MNIGVVIDGPWQGNDALIAVIQREVVDLTKGKYDVRFPEDKRLVADWTQAGVKAAVDRALRDPQIHIVMAMGLLAASEVGQRPRLLKPVLAPFVVDAKLQGLPFANGRSGRKNFSYLTLPWSFDRDVAAFREIVPFDHLIVLGSKLYLEAVPGLRQRVEESAKEVGVPITIIPVGQEVDVALAQLPADAQAVYVAPMLQLPPSEVGKLI